MHNNAANDQEPDHYLYRLGELLCVFSDVSVNRNLHQEFSTDRQIEDGPNADRTKEPDKRGLLHMFDLMDVFVHGENDWEPAHKENQNTQEDEPIDWDDVVFQEESPRTHSAKPHEDREVEQHVDGRLQRVVHCLQAKPVTVFLSVSGRRHVS